MRSFKCVGIRVTDIWGRIGSESQPCTAGHSLGSTPPSRSGDRPQSLLEAEGWLLWGLQDPQCSPETHRDTTTGGLCPGVGPCGTALFSPHRGKGACSPLVTCVCTRSLNLPVAQLLRKPQPCESWPPRIGERPVICSRAVCWGRRYR